MTHHICPEMDFEEGAWRLNYSLIALHFFGLPR